VEIERINERWSSLIGALTLVSPFWSLHENERDKNGVKKLLVWFLKSVKTSGIDWVHKRLGSMYDYSRHLSGAPVEESTRPEIDSGTPGFSRDGTFKGSPFFKNTSWHLLNATDKEGWTIEAHWAFSLGKRARGFPTQNERIKSLLKFKKRTLTPSPEGLEVKEPYLFAKEYVKGFNPNRVRNAMNIHISDSTAACLEYPRLKGGRHQFHKDCVDKMCQSYAVFRTTDEPLYLPSGKELKIDPIFLKEFDGETILNGSILVQQLGNSGMMIEFAFSYCRSDPDIPFRCTTEPYAVFDGEDEIFAIYTEKPQYECTDPTFLVPNESRMDTVDDDGGKARVIGVTKACLIDLQHIFRTAITALLNCDYSVPSLSDEGLGKTADRLLLPDPPFDSADLTAATDNSPIEEVRALGLGAVEQMEESGMVPQWLIGNLKPILECSLRPTLVQGPVWWPKNRKGDFPFTTKRSVPMGQAHSWVLLCLGQLYHRKRTSSGQKLERKVICGDDSCSSGGTIESYLGFRDSLRSSGYEISNGTDVISNLCIQYTEKLTVLIESGERRFLRNVRYPPVKSLLSKVPPTRAPQVRGSREKTTISTRGAAAQSATLWLNLPFSIEGYAERVRHAATVLSLFANHALIKKAKKYDIPLWLPREFGGLGFPHPDGKPLSHVRPFFLKGLSSLLSDNRNLDYILNFRTLGSHWHTPVRSIASQETRRLTDSWVGSVFTMGRKITQLPDLQASTDLSLWERPVWLDVQQFYELVFNEPLEKNNWDQYDRLKNYLFESTGLKWVPIKQVLDHIEATFRNEHLFMDATKKEPDVPSFGRVSKRVHQFYKSIIRKQPNPNWRSYRSKTTEDLLNVLHWRQNLVLVCANLPGLEKLKSKY
jgi:hypothetical protein